VDTSLEFRTGNFLIFTGKACKSSGFKFFCASEGDRLQPTRPSVSRFRCARMLAEHLNFCVITAQDEGRDYVPCKSIFYESDTVAVILDVEFMPPESMTSQGIILCLYCF
jgi:hypothetical protein